MSTFIESRSDNRFRFAGMEKARFIHASESEDTDWLNAPLLKRLTGGNDITIEYKGRDRYSIRPGFTVWITSNYPPKMKPGDEAAWYRLRVIDFPFSKKGKEDKRLKEKLQEPENRTGILSWIIEGAIRWYGRDQGLETPQSVEDLTESFREALDYIYQFAEDHYEIAENMINWEALKKEEFYTPLDQVYTEYKVWQEENGAQDLKKTTFASKLRERLGGINLYTNKCRVRIADPITGTEKRTRVIAGIRPKRAGISKKSGKVKYDNKPF